MGAPAPAPRGIRRRRRHWLPIALVILAVLWALMPMWTVPPSRLEVAVLGGQPQRLLTLAQDRPDLPVVLFLHGGPGVSVMPAARALHAALAEDAIVVHWDQPGSATACLADGESLTMAQVLDAAEAAAEHVAQAHGVKKIGLIGASWGSVVGLQLAARRPELFWAYVGEGQVLNLGRGEAEARTEALRRARERGEAEREARLLAMQPPLQEPKAVGALRAELAALGMIWHRLGPYAWLAGRLLVGPEHTLSEKLRTPLCVARATAALGDALAGLRLDETVRRTAVPTFAFQGRHDYLAPPGVVADWAAGVRGAGVEVVWFEASGHVPSLEQPEEYAAALRERVLPHAR